MKLQSHFPYDQVRQFKVSLGHLPIEVVSKPGLPDWDQVLPSTELLAQYHKLLPSGNTLLYGSHHGALAVAITSSVTDGQFFITDNNSLALEMTRRTLDANHISSVLFLTEIELPQALLHQFNQVIIQNPKSRKLMRRWLLQAHQALIVGGNLYIAGSNKSGIQSVFADASQLFADRRMLAYKKGNRVAQWVKSSELTPDLDWSHAPGIAPGTWMEFSLTISNRKIQIRSLPGVFSYDHLDDGTKMLLDNIKNISGARVLDIGCGYGIIGLFAAIQGAGWVDFVDNDLLAIASCKETLSLNQIENASIYTGDLLEPIGSNKYDFILSNPPFHAGQAVEYQIANALIKQAYHALNPGGQIIIVANKFIRYDHWIKEIFENASILAESGKFHLLCGIKAV